MLTAATVPRPVLGTPFRFSLAAPSNAFVYSSHPMRAHPSVPGRALPRTLVIFLPVLAAAIAAAQTAPAGPAAPPEAIRLSPFEVRLDEDSGYIATNTLAGSRLNTELRDTPAAITV